MECASMKPLLEKAVALAAQVLLYLLAVAAGLALSSEKPRVSDGIWPQIKHPDYWRNKWIKAKEAKP